MSCHNMMWILSCCMCVNKDLMALAESCSTRDVHAGYVHLVPWMSSVQKVPVLAVKAAGVLYGDHLLQVSPRRMAPNFHKMSALESTAKSKHWTPQRIQGEGVPWCCGVQRDILSPLSPLGRLFRISPWKPARRLMQKFWCQQRDPSLRVCCLQRQWQSHACFFLPMPSDTTRWQLWKISQMSYLHRHHRMRILY